MASGQTIVSYGSNLTIRRCTTTEFSQQPVYDDSGTDLMYHRFVVRVTGYVHGFPGWCQLQVPLNPLAGQTGSASQNFIGMRVELTPRKSFAMRIGATTVNSTAQNSTGGYLALYAEPYPEGNRSGITHLDVNNGPRGSIKIVRVVADNVFQVEAEFEVCKVECYAGTEAFPTGYPSDTAAIGTAPGNTKGILSHRWSCVDSIDTNLRTTRIYSGRLRTASANLSPNDFRYYVMPPLAQGLRRDSIQFSVSPDGMNLDYTIHDVEVNVSAPYPAKKWAIQHSESIDQGLWVRASIDIQLSSERGVAKSDLITIAMNIVYAKILGGRNNVANLKQFYFEHLSITDYIGDEQTVAVSARVRRMSGMNAAGVPKKVDAFQDWRVGTARIGKLLDKAFVAPATDPNWDQDKNFGGRADAPGNHPYYEGPVLLIGAFLPYLQSPCSDTHMMVNQSSLSSNMNGSANGAPQATVTANVDVDWGTETDDELLAVEEIENIYTMWKMEAIYDDREMKIPLPVANSSYAAGQVATSVVQVSPPQSRRIVRIEAERVGAWPQMPSGAQLEGITGQSSGSSLSSGYVALSQTFLRKKTRFATPFYTSGGQRAYRVAVDYYFSLNRRPEPSESLAVGRAIWTLDGDISTNTTATMGWPT